MSLTRGPEPCFTPQPPPHDRQLTGRQPSGALLPWRWKADVWSVCGCGHTATAHSSLLYSQYTVPCKPVEQNRHCYSALRSAWLLSTEFPSRSVTLNLLQYRTAHQPYSPAHTDTMVTTTLCCHIAGILNTVQEVQRVASAPLKVPGWHKGNVVPESVWESRGAAAFTFGLSSRPLCAR